MQEKLPDKDLIKVMAWLAEKVRCPLCSYKHNLGDLSVISKSTNTNNGVMIHTDCSGCKSALLYSLGVKGGEVFLSGLITDLTYKDAVKFKGKDPIDLDEVIDWHNFLREFKGDFKRLLER